MRNILFCDMTSCHLTNITRYLGVLLSLSLRVTNLQEGCSQVLDVCSLHQMAPALLVNAMRISVVYE